MFLGVLGCTFHTQSASFLSTAMHHSPPSGNPELRVCVIPTVVFSDFEVLIPFLANGFCHSLTSLVAVALKCDTAENDMVENDAHHEIAQ